MRNRALLLALLIATSLAPVAGCSDNNSDSASNQSSDLAAEQSHHASDPKGNPPLPVNDPDSAQGSKATNNARPSDAQQLQQLQAQVQSLTQTSVQRKQRLDGQAQRINKLEQTVKALSTRLRKLPQPTARTGNASTSGSDKQPATPDTVSPQADDSDDQSSDSNDDDASAAADSASPPANVNLVSSCSVHHPTRAQFDVFFQAATNATLGNATDAVKSAHLSDWFAMPANSRLYVGRYDRCPTAERRRRDVSSRTGLDLHIAAVTPNESNHPTSSEHTSSSHAHGYGSADISHDPHSRHRSRPIQPAIQPARFRIIGVEIRGTHHYLGVAAQGDTRLGGVTWLTPGDRYGGWQLRNIRTDSGRAVFSDGQRTIAVGLPARG